MGDLLKLNVGVKCSNCGKGSTNEDHIKRSVGCAVFWCGPECQKEWEGKQQNKELEDETTS